MGGQKNALYNFLSGRGNGIVDFTLDSWKRRSERIVDTVKKGGDVIAKDKNTAREIARQANGGKPPVHDLGHKGGRPHFHPNGRPGGNFFY